MKTLTPILTAVFLAGCVSSKAFKQKDAEAAREKTRAESAEAKAAELGKTLESTKADYELKLKTGGETLAGLQKSNKDLQESLDADRSQLSQKVSALIKDRDEHAKRLADANRRLDESSKKLGETQQRLDEAEAAKKTLADAKAAELALAAKSYEDLASGLKSEIAAGQVQITELKGKLTLNVVDQILFDSGQAEVKSDGKKVLDKVGAALNQLLDKDVRIEGHTDNKPIAGALKSRYASNWELSTTRATAVARYLQDHAKVDGKRLVAAGFGEYKPRASNETAEGRAQNRRIEIVLVARD